jgi:hypothetical protein
MIAYWPMNEGSGSTINDLSGDGYTGTINGATWTMSGEFNDDLSFNGSSGDVALSNDPLTTTGPQTISAWIYLTGWGEGGYGAVISDVALACQVLSSQQAIRCTHDGHDFAVTSGSSIQLNTWYLFTAVG